jgi:hypothetical protein
MVYVAAEAKQLSGSFLVIIPNTVQIAPKIVDKPMVAGCSLTLSANKLWET